jgi:hypothetical protein
MGEQSPPEAPPHHPTTHLSQSGPQPSILPHLTPLPSPARDLRIFRGMLHPKIPLQQLLHPKATYHKLQTRRPTDSKPAPSPTHPDPPKPSGLLRLVLIHKIRLVLNFLPNNLQARIPPHHPQKPNLKNPHPTNPNNPHPPPNPNPPNHLHPMLPIPPPQIPRRHQTHLHRVSLRLLIRPSRQAILPRPGIASPPGPLGSRGSLVH